MKDRKMMRQAIRVASILALCSLAVGWAQAQQRLGVVVQRATYDPVKHEVDILFYNSSKHDVTAFNFSLRIDFADGTSRLDNEGLDLAADPSYRGFLLLAGTTREERVEQPVTNKEVTRVTGFADVVVYEDASAEVLNEAAFKGFVASRKARVVATQKVNEVLRQALTADNPGKAALDALDKLKETYKSGPVSNAKTGDEPVSDVEVSAMREQIHLAISNLNERFHGPLTTDRLQEYVKQHDDLVPTLKFHSELRRIGPGGPDTFLLLSVADYRSVGLNRFVRTTHNQRGGCPGFA